MFFLEWKITLGIHLIMETMVLEEFNYNLMTYDVKKVCEIENVNHHIVKFKHLVNPYLYRFFKFVI